MKSKLKISAAIVLAVLLVGLGVYFITPHHITVPDGEEIYVTYVEPTLEVVGMNSTAYTVSIEYHFSPGDDGYDEIVEALESITYHNCFKTMSGVTSVSNVSYVVYVWVGDECYGFYDRGYLSADKIYYVSKNNIENIRNVIE